MNRTTRIALGIAACTFALGAPSIYAGCGACGGDETKAHVHEAGHEHSHAQAEAKMMDLYTLAQSQGFTTLAKAVEVAGLQKTLMNDGPFTIFAPTDEAFAALPEGALEELLANPDQLKQVLLYHVVVGKVTAADVVKLNSAETAMGEKINVNAKKGVTLNGETKVVMTDVMASNGVVHVIDSVLLPPAS